MLELLVAVAVLGIVVSIAAPSFAGLVRDTRLTAMANEMLGVLFYTRSEAIRRGRRVTVCTSSNQLGCEANVGWHRGWIVFDDGNGNGTYDEGEARLLVGAGRSDGSLVTTASLPVRDYVSYVSSGATRTVTGALQMGTITACSDGAAREIIISATGRPRVERAGEC